MFYFIKKIIWLFTSNFKIRDIGLSVDKVLSIAKTVTTLKIRLPISNQILTKTMIVTKLHKKIEQLFNPDFWDNF